MDLKENDIIPWLQQNKSFSLNLECAVVFQAGICLWRMQGLMCLSQALGKYLPADKVLVNPIKMNPEPKQCCCFSRTPHLFVAVWSFSGGLSDDFYKCILRWCWGSLKGSVLNRVHVLQCWQASPFLSFQCIGEHCGVLHSGTTNSPGVSCEGRNRQSHSRCERPFHIQRRPRCFKNSSGQIFS